MKTKAAYFLLLIMAMGQVSRAQDREGFASFYIGGWDLHIVSPKSYYPTYLADPHAIRFDLSSQKILFSNIDNQDEVNNNGSYMGKLTIKPANRLTLLRLAPASNPRLGIEVDVGVALPFTMRRGNHDLIAFDGIFHMAISGAPTEWLSLRLAKHHYCSHRGVEYWAGKTNSPVDFDPGLFNLYVRDDFVLSAAFRPLYFTGIRQLDILQIYIDLNTYIPGYGVTGMRQNRPNTHAKYIFQGGAELEYYFERSFLGGVFTALNVSAWQENGYSPNYSAIAGYIFPQKISSKKLRIGVNYYNGRCINNEFYNYKERFLAFHIAFDL